MLCAISLSTLVQMSNWSRFLTVVMLVLSFSAQAFGGLPRVFCGAPLHTHQTNVVGHPHLLPTAFHKRAGIQATAHTADPCDRGSHSGCCPHCSASILPFAANRVAPLAAVYAVAQTRDLPAAAYQMGLLRLLTGGIERPPKVTSL